MIAQAGVAGGDVAATAEAEGLAVFGYEEEDGAMLAILPPKEDDGGTSAFDQGDAAIAGEQAAVAVEEVVHGGHAD